MLYLHFNHSRPLHVIVINIKVCFNYSIAECRESAYERCTVSEGCLESNVQWRPEFGFKIGQTYMYNIGGRTVAEVDLKAECRLNDQGRHS